MTLEKLIELKLERLETIPAVFASKVSDEQEKIYRRILLRLEKLKSKNGLIQVTQANLKEANEIAKDLTYVLSNGEYKNAVKEFIKNFDTQSKINDDILKETLEDFTISDKSGIILNNYKRIATESLISESVLTSVLSGPIKKEIETAVLNNLSIAELTENLSKITVGDTDQLGRLERYANQIAYDSIAVADRAYTKSISEDNGVEYFRYTGGKIRDTRSFCNTRNNKIYHIKEIEKWGLLEWDGRIPGTNSSNIFTNLGGFRCRHSLVPISEFRVPKDVLERNKAGIEQKVVEAVKPIEVKFKPAILKKWGVELDDRVYSLLDKEVEITQTKSGSISISNESKIKINRTEERYKKSKYHQEYVYYHELGHVIHTQKKLIISTKRVSNEYAKHFNDLSITFKKELNKALIEGDKILKTLGGSNLEAQKKLVDKYKLGSYYDARVTFISFQDSVMALTKGKFGFGHSKEYMKQIGRSEAEMFAHSMENFFKGNPIFEDLAPKTYAKSKKYIESLLPK